MNNELKENLPRLLNKLISYTFIFQDQQNTTDYNLIKTHFTELSSFLKDSFNLELVQRKQCFGLRKLSVINPIGLSTNEDKEAYILLALSLAVLSRYKIGNSFRWTYLINEIGEKYNALFNKELSSYNKTKYSFKIKKVLVEDYKYIISIDEADNDIMYEIIREIDSSSFKKIELDNKFKAVRVSQALLLNGFISTKQFENEYFMLKDDLKVLNDVRDIFDDLYNSHNEGYRIYEHTDMFFLIFDGYSKTFPNPNNASGTLAIEILSKLAPGVVLNKEEFKEIIRSTIAWDKRINKNNTSENIEMKKMLKDFLHYNFIEIINEEKFVVKDLCRLINAKYEKGEIDE